MLKPTENVKPLSQDDLDRGDNERGVRDSDERGLLTPAMPGSTK